MDKEKKEVAEVKPKRLEWLNNKHGLENIDHAYTQGVSDFIDDILRDAMNDLDIIPSTLNEIANIYVATKPIPHMLNETKYPYVPTMKDWINVSYDTCRITFTFYAEPINLGCYLCESEDNFYELCRAIGLDINYQMFLLAILKDYLMGMSPPLEKSVLDESAKQIIETELHPLGFEHSTNFKIQAFCRAFIDDEFADKSFIESLNMIHKDYLDEIMRDRITPTKYENTYKFKNLSEKMFSDINKLYRYFDCISSLEQLNQIRNEINKDFYVNSKLARLLHICERIFVLWDKVKAEALKKYPKYVQIKTVKLSIRNRYGVLKKEHDGYFNTSPEGMPFIDYVNRTNVSSTSNAYVSNTYSRYYGQSLDATFNFDNHIIFMDDGDHRRNATDEEMDRYLEISLKHEMGHIVHYCDLIYNNPVEVYEYIRKTLGVIDDRAVKEYDDTPEDHRLDYTYWYYTLRPFERIANELMDISIEDMYKADMVEMPDSVKELIKKD